MDKLRLFQALARRAGIRRSSDRAGAKRRWLIGTFDLLLIATVACVLFFAASLVIQVSRGYSKTLPAPKWTVRLQVVDGSSGKDELNRALEHVKQCADADLQLSIVETSAFSQTSLPTTFLVAREQDLEPTKQLAIRLGLEPGFVVYEPLDNNKKHITATLILGTESDQWLSALDSKEKETGI